MHGVTELKALGATVTDYRERFRLRYRNNHPVRDGHYPMDRVIAGEEFSDVTVEVESAADETVSWVHRIRSLVLTNAAGEPTVSRSCCTTRPNGRAPRNASSAPSTRTRRRR